MHEYYAQFNIKLKSDSQLFTPQVFHWAKCIDTKKFRAEGKLELS